MEILNLSSLAAGILAFILALMAWLNRRYERVNVSFAIFMLMVSLVSLLNFLTWDVRDLFEYQKWMRFLIPAVTLMSLSMLYFILELTGYIRRMNEKILGIKVGAMLLFSVIFTPTVTILLVFTRILVKGYSPRAGGGFNADWSLWMVPVELYTVFYIVYIMVMIVRSHREAEAGPRKVFLRQNIIGILLLMISGPLIGIILPMLGIESTIFLDVITVASSLIFYLAINRYQFDTIHELNVGLEKKVEERTRHLRDTQAKLVISQRLAAMGRMVAGIAHELNNPVGAIASGCGTLTRAKDMLQDSLGKTFNADSLHRPELTRPINAINEVSRSILQGSERVTGIVDKLKSFVRLDEAELKDVDLHRGIEDAIEMIQPNLKPGIEIQTDFGEIGRVTCYPAKLNQLFLLMLDNANQAIEEKGTITISTRREDGGVRIAIADTGIGIPRKNMAKIFDPGFTTWGVRIGVGLGLAICYRIAEEHHGRIEVASEVGRGTTFTIFISVSRP